MTIYYASDKRRVIPPPHVRGWYNTSIHGMAHFFDGAEKRTLCGQHASVRLERASRVCSRCMAKMKGKNMPTAPTAHVTELELEVLIALRDGKDPWHGTSGRVGSRRYSGAIGRALRKGLIIDRAGVYELTVHGRIACGA